MIQIKSTVSKLFLPSTPYVYDQSYSHMQSNLILKPHQLDFTQILSGLISLTEKKIVLP